MGGGTIDYSKLTDDVVKPPPKEEGELDYSKLTDDTKGPGIIDNLSSRAGEMWDVMKDVGNLVEQTAISKVPDEWLSRGELFEKQQFAAEVTKARENAIPALKRAGEKIAEGVGDLASLYIGRPTPGANKMVDEVLSSGGQFAKEQIAEVKREGLSSIYKYPINKAINVGTGLATFPFMAINDAAQALLGVSGRDFHALTVDERSSVIKTTAANITTIGMSKWLHGVLPEAFTPVGQALKGVTEGIAGGTVYGLIDKAGTPEQLTSMITSSIAFAGFGMAGELVFGKNAESVANLAALRNVIYSPRKTLPEIVAGAEAIAKSKTIDEAAGRQAGLTGKPTVVDTETPLDVLKGAEGNGIVSNDGKAVLVNPSLAEDTFFKEHGFVQGQDVSYKGQTYTLADAWGDNVIIKDGNIEKVVPKSEVRRLGALASTSLPKSEWTVTKIAKQLQEEPSETQVATTSLLLSPDIPGTNSKIVNIDYGTQGSKENPKSAVSQEVAENIANSGFSKKFASIVNEMIGPMFAEIRRVFTAEKNPPDFAKIQFAGINLDPHAYGWHHPNGIGATTLDRFGIRDIIGAKLEHLSSELRKFFYPDPGTGAITLNPFLINADLKSVSTIFDADTWREWAGQSGERNAAMSDAAHSMGTLIHELAHNWEGTHEVEFWETVEKAADILEPIAKQYHDRLQELFNSQEYWDLRDQYSEAVNDADKGNYHNEVAKRLFQTKAIQRDFSQLASEVSKGKFGGTEFNTSNEKTRVRGARSDEQSVEKITAAAVRKGDKIGLGNTHYEAEADLTKTAGRNYGLEYGFQTSTGRFVTRSEAADIALKAKQITEETPLRTSANVGGPGLIAELTKEMEPSPIVDNTKESAASNNMLSNPDGTIIRDATDGRIIVRGGEPLASAAKINKTGQHDEPELIKDENGGNITPPPNSKDMSPPSPSEMPALSKDLVAPMGKFEKIYKHLEAFNIAFAKKSANMRAFDSLTGSKLFENVLDPVRKAIIDYGNAISEWAPTVKELMKYGKDFAPEMWNHIGRYIETMNDVQIMMGGRGGGPMPNHEILQAADWSGKNGGETGDLKKVRGFVREADRIGREWDAAKEKYKDDQGKLKEINQVYEEQLRGLPDVHQLSLKEQDMAGQVKKILENEPFSLYRISNLYDVWANPEKNLTQEEYAAKHGLTEEHLYVADKITQLYKIAADKMGIPEYRRIGGYAAHIREYGDLPMSREFNARRGKIPLDRQYGETANFFNDQVRTGEMDDYIENPLAAFAQYIHNGLKRNILTPVVKQAARAAEGEFDVISQHPEGGVTSATWAKNIVTQYLDNATGRQRFIDKSSEVLVGNVLKQLGVIDKDADLSKSRIVKNMTDAVIAWTSSGLIGGKPELAIRDFYTFVTLHNSRFGEARTMRALNMLANGDYQAPMRAGLVPGLTINDFQTLQEAQAAAKIFEEGNTTTGNIKEVSQKIGNFMLTFNGQKSIFQLVHALSYQEGFENAMTHVKSFHEGKITGKQLVDNTDLNSYDIPIANRFIDLVNQGQQQEAASFLARQKGMETAFDHGLSDHPYLWNSNPGRLFGQMGIYPTSSLNFVARLATRGSMGQRTAAMTRFVGTTALTKATGLALGLDLSNWSALHGLSYGVFAGGPLMPWNQGHPIDASVGLVRQALGNTPTKQQNEAMYEMFRPYGWHHVDGQWQWDSDRFKDGFRSMWVPGSFAFHNYVDAWNLSQGGQGLPTSIARITGFNLSTKNKDFLNAYNNGIESPERDYDKQLIDVINPFAKTITP